MEVLENIPAPAPIKTIFFQSLGCVKNLVDTEVMLGISVGVIRWAQTFEDDSVEFGVQMLAPRAEPVSLEPVIGSRGEQKALLLPDIPALLQPAALVAIPGNYQPQREFMLALAKQVDRVRATELLEKTACYELFRFVNT